MDRTQVLIVGAGPTGLLLAIWLRTLSPKLNFRIVDQATGPCQQSRAIVIHARTLELYRQLGLAEAILKGGKITENVEIFKDGSTRGHLVFGAIGGNVSKYPFVLTCPQDVHERILIRHLNTLGVQVEWSKKVKSMSVEDGGNEAVFEDGQATGADYVVGCDGGHSVVRDYAGISLEGSAYESRFFVTDVVKEGKLGDDPNLRICLGNGTFAINLPLEQPQLVRLVGQMPDEFATFDDIRPLLQDTVGFTFNDVKWSSTYKVSHRVADHFRHKNVFLCGDAAHVHSPVGGQGMNTGLGDATNLAWKLVQTIQGRLSSAILDTYEAERRAFAQILVQTTDRAFYFITDKGFLGWFAREVFIGRLLPLLWKTSFFPPFFFARVSQTALTYANGPLGATSPGSRGAGPGDRLPWVPFDQTDNYEPLKACDWQLHEYLSDTSQESVDERYGFPLHRFQLTAGGISLGLKSNVYYLIRPDGYIAAVLDQHTVNESLHKFVDTWFTKH